MTDTDRTDIIDRTDLPVGATVDPSHPDALEIPHVPGVHYGERMLAPVSAWHDGAANVLRDPTGGYWEIGPDVPVGTLPVGTVVYLFHPHDTAYSPAQLAIVKDHAESYTWTRPLFFPDLRTTMTRNETRVRTLLPR